MENQKNQQLVEENDQTARFCNIIIHGVVESTSENNNDAKISDEGFFTSLLEIIGIAVTAKSISRIGKLDRAKKRPIKVYLGSEAGKINIMNLKNLKGNELYKGINITEDYTVAEREMIRKMSEEIKTKNSQELPNSKYVYKLHGTPKKRATNEEVSEACSKLICNNDKEDSIYVYQGKGEEIIQHNEDNEYSINRFSVDYAVRGTAKCKVCKKLINRNDLRIGKLVPFKSKHIKQFYHVDCAFKSFEKAKTPIDRISDPSELDGLMLIDSTDKVRINDLLRNVPSQNYHLLLS